VATREIQRPIHQVQCDHAGCDAVYVPTPGFYQRNGDLARIEAREAGWDVPPPRGKGSRSPLDFCPKHHVRTVTED
jgi:hypothetical protein